MIKIPDKYLDRAIALILVFGLVLSIGAVADTVFSPPYRYESGFKLYQSDLDLNGKNITQFSTPVSNTSRNYTIDSYDYFVLVDTASRGLTVNLSLEHPANHTGKEYKIMRTTDTKSLLIDSARDFLGNTSNTSLGFSSGQVFYYNFTPGSTYNLTMMSIKVYGTPATKTGVRLALYNNTNPTTPQPYQLLDKSSNTSVYGDGWVNTTGWNGTTVVQAGTVYWIAFQSTNSSEIFYVSDNQSTESHRDVMTYNQGTQYGIFQGKVNVSAFANNQSVNNRVPNIAVELAYIDGTFGTFNLTNPKYVPTFIQSDGAKWW